MQKKIEKLHQTISTNKDKKIFDTKLNQIVRYLGIPTLLKMVQLQNELNRGYRKIQMPVTFRLLFSSSTEAHSDMNSFKTNF